MPNCSNLKFLDYFDGYIAQVRLETDCSTTLLLECQDEICSAIWGEGNPDISGIGVSSPVPAGNPKYSAIRS
jgi:hypothetical protein